jgi:hypothetical protein
MKEIDFDPNTMTSATADDISRIYRQLWGVELGVNIMEILEYRTVYDTDPAKTYEIADVLLDGAVLPVSIPADEARAIQRKIDAKLRVQEVPQDYRIFNKRQPDNRYYDVSDFFNGIKSTATSEWVRRHLNND